MNERIRLIREDSKLTRAAFGERIGVSGDVINNLERGRVEIKDHIVKLICAEYSVNEEWLKYGNGDIYKEDDNFSLDDFAKQHGATDVEIEFLKIYFELDKDIRQALISHFKNRFGKNSIYSSVPNTAAELEEKYGTNNENNVG